MLAEDKDKPSHPEKRGDGFSMNGFAWDQHHPLVDRRCFVSSAR